MMSLEQRQPLIHHFIFGRSDCFLFEENGAHGSLGNGLVLLAKESERLTIKVLQSPSVHAAKVALAYARASNTVAERSFARITNESQQISLVFKKDNAAQQSLRFRQKLQFGFNDHSERSFAADEEVDQIHSRLDVIT